jgi:hypothetical protein
MLLPSTSKAIELASYQNGQVEQIAGQAHTIYIAIDRIKIRNTSSLESKQVGLITEENRDSLFFKSHNDLWLEVTDSEGRHLGYSYKSVFHKKPVVSLSTGLNYFGDKYNIEFVGYIFDPTEDSYRQSFYYYQVFKNGEPIFSKGRESIGKILRKKMIRDQGEVFPTQFHLLKTDSRSIGWLFGWNKHADEEGKGYYPDLDFSFARALIPSHDRLNKNSETELYTTEYYGLKFKSIADLLDHEKNQILLTPVTYHLHLFACNACSGKYYMPSEVLITAGESRTTVKNSKKITINLKLVDKNPEYAFAIAFNQDDHAAMKVAASQFDEQFKIASEHCGKYDVSLKQTIASSEYTFFIDIKEHWTLIDQRLRIKKEYDPISSRYAAECLYEVLPPDFVWHVFYRTGLFPSRKSVDEYIDHKYMITLYTY